MTVEIHGVVVAAWLGFTVALVWFAFVTNRQASMWREFAEDCADHDSRTVTVVDGGATEHQTSDTDPFDDEGSA